MSRDLRAEELTEWARRLGTAATYYNWCVDRYVTGDGRLYAATKADREFRAMRIQAALDGKKVTWESGVRSLEIGKAKPPTAVFLHHREGSRTVFLDVITRVTVRSGRLTVSCAPKRFREGRCENKTV